MTTLDIRSRYQLTTSKAENVWFTRTTREQDCFYRLYQCEVDLHTPNPTRQDRFVDGPA